MEDAELEILLRPILDLYSQIEIDLLLNVASRFDTYETIGGTLEWYMDKLQEMGAFYQSNVKIMARYAGLSSKEIKHLMEDLNMRAIMSFADADLNSLLNSTANRNTLTSILGNLEDDIKIINTKALESAQKAYMDVLTKGFIETSSGVYSYQESIRRGLVGMAERGITAASYMRANGQEVRYSLEGTVRRDILTRAHQVAFETQMNTMRELGHNLIYVSQHLGARTHKTNKIANHAGWQGKVYMLDGSSDRYPNLVEATGYGDIQGLAGVNCRHHISSYIEGVTKLPTRIDEAENERIYQLSQEQRKLERDVRKAKKRLVVAKQMDDKELIKSYRQNLNAKTAKLDDFVSKHPELRRSYDRTRVTEDHTLRAKTTAEKVGVSAEYWERFMTEDEREFCKKFPEKIRWIDRRILDENNLTLPSYDFESQSDGLLYELKTPIKKPKYSNIARTISETVAKSGKNRFVINLKDRKLTDKLKSDLSQYNIRHSKTTIKALKVFSKGEIIDIKLKK